MTSIYNVAHFLSISWLLGFCVMNILSPLMFDCNYALGLMVLAVILSGI